MMSVHSIKVFLSFQFYQQLSQFSTLHRIYLPFITLSCSLLFFFQWTLSFPMSLITTRSIPIHWSLYPWHALLYSIHCLYFTCDIFLYVPLPSKTWCDKFRILKFPAKHPSSLPNSITLSILPGWILDITFNTL